MTAQTQGSTLGFAVTSFQDSRRRGRAVMWGSELADGDLGRVTCRHVTQCGVWVVSQPPRLLQTSGEFHLAVKLLGVVRGILGVGLAAGALVEFDQLSA